MNERQGLAYFFAFAISTVFVQALMLGYDTSGMRGVFLAAAIAYVPLGLVVGSVWSPRLLVASVLAGIPTWLFIFTLYQWSIFTALTATVESIPVVFEPLSVSVFFFIGAWVGKRLSSLFKQRKFFAGHV